MNRVDEARRRAPEWLTPLPSFDGAPADGYFPHERPDELAAHAPAPTAAPQAVAPRAIAREQGVPVIPTVPSSAALVERLDEASTHKLVVGPHIPAASREQYRQLAAVLHRAQAESRVKVVMVASAVAGEGKTITAVNLALTFSESYKRRVLLVDADLRQPSLHRVLGLDGPGDREDSSEGRVAEWTWPVRQVTRRLDLVMGGESSQDPMAGLTSERMHRLVQRAREAFDWVIIDTPPVGVLADAGLVAALADKTVLVVKADSTPYDLIARAIDTLGREKIAGVVLNGAAAPPQSANYAYAK